MLHPTTRAIVILLLLASSWGCDSGKEDDSSGSVTVMSLNLFLGSDILRIAEVSDAEQSSAAAGEVYTELIASDFSARATAIASTIEAENPHLIGLQEVSTVFTQTPSDVAINNSPNATVLRVDFLDLLQTALEARGLNYRVAAFGSISDMEFPAITNGQSLFDVRHKSANVILAREDVTTSSLGSTTFEQTMTFQIGNAYLPFQRGYQRVIATVGDFSFLMINTHIEEGSSGMATNLRERQAAELALRIRGIDGPVVFTGDLGDASTSSPTNSYAQLTGSITPALTGNLTDPGVGTAATCCQASDLRNASSSLSTRNDFVMHRGFTGASSYEVVLDDPASRVTSNGDLLWASDHAGVVATLTYGGQ